MRRKYIAPGLTLQQTDEGFWLIADSGEIKGAFSLNSLSGLVHDAFAQWAAQQLKDEPEQPHS